jgi:hypothetical protein
LEDAMKIAATLALLLLLGACGGTPTTGPRATVMMRDGSNVSGMVLSSTAAEIKIAGEDNVTRTIPMAQVRSVEYGDGAAAAPAAPAPPSNVRATGSPATAAPAAPARSAPARIPAAAAPTVSPAPPTPATTPTGPTGPTPPPAQVVELPRPTLDDVTTETHVVPSGTEISVQTHETIDGSTAANDQLFDANVTENVRDADGKVVIPAGAKAQILIKSLTKGGKIQGQSDLVLDLASVSIDGRQYALSTADLEEKGRAGVGKNKRTAEFLGGGAAIGGIVGALLGGGKGAAIGAGAGAGGGTLAQAMTKGSIRVEAETILVFKLDMALEVVARRR